jgi:peptidoglycan/xylan/chitin deacetylase (PgdA/CDA1 family)
MRRVALIAAPLVVALGAVGVLWGMHGLWPGRLSVATVRAAFLGPKVVAITIDDGPSRTYTPSVLAVLKGHRARATFFVVGRAAEDATDLVQAEIAQGHEVGTHSLTHALMGRIDEDAARLEVYEGAAVVQRIAGRRATYFRPPRGVLTPAETQAASELGLRTVLWDQSLDHASDVSPRAAADRVLSRIMPGDIVLLHDGPGDRRRDVEALDLLLDDLAARGFRVVPLEQLPL